MPSPSPRIRPGWPTPPVAGVPSARVAGSVHAKGVARFLPTSANSTLADQFLWELCRRAFSLLSISLPHRPTPIREVSGMKSPRFWLPLAAVLLLFDVNASAQISPDQAADMLLASARRAYNEKNYNF